MNTICIYHGNCADGFTAAWAVWKRFGDSIEYFAGFHGDEPPNVKGKRVILVDFSYPEATLRHMAQYAKSILVLDHHKSAQEALSWVPNAVVNDAKIDPWMHHIGDDGAVLENQGHPNIVAWFDMEKSGAHLAWEFFHQRKPVPELVKHVEDRDLWRFKLYGTREIQSVVFSHPYTFDAWEGLAKSCQTEDRRVAMIKEGQAIERKHFKDIDELVKATRRTMVIGGETVWVANLPYTLASDACHQMCKEPMYPACSGEYSIDACKPAFAACYYDSPKGRFFSLRSIGDFDVQEIAKKYGGGGHKNAAGFSMPIGWEGDK